MLPGVTRRESGVQIAISVRGVRRGEIQDGKPQHRPHSAGAIGARGGVGKKVHVVAAGDSA